MNSNYDDALKSQIIDFCLKFIRERNREVLVDDIKRFTLEAFQVQLSDRQDDVRGADEWFVESIINEMSIDYKFVYLTPGSKSIGLTTLGREVLNKGGFNRHTQFLADARREKEESEAKERRWNTRNAIASVILSVLSIVSIIVSALLPRYGSWTFPVTMFVSGFLLGFGLKTPIRGRCQRRHKLGR